MGALRKPTPGSLTVAEFLAWDSGDRSGRRWQLCDGVPVAMAPATDAHGSIQSELNRLIGNHLVANRPGCRVVIDAGVVPRVRANKNVRIPDLAVTCAPPRGERLLDSPLVLIEILSPSNVDETWANVWSYTTIPSVREILVVSSTEIGADLLRRLDDGNWPAEPQHLTRDDELAFPSLDLTLPLPALYRTTGLV